MDIITDIKKELRILIYGKDLEKADETGKETASLLGKTQGYLSQIINLSGTYPTPLEVIIPLMKRRKRYKLLERLCWECGGVFVKLPAVKMAKGDEYDIANEFQEKTVKAAQAFIEFLKKDNPEAYERFFRANREMITTAMSTEKYAAKKVKGQGELFDE